MFRYFLVLFSLSAVFTSPLPDEHAAGRIVNGVETTIEARPYQVSIQRITNGHHSCGGSIISEDIVITAAHCIRNVEASNLQVRLGSTHYNEGGILVGVKAMKYHEKYDTELLWYDIAILKLDKPVKQSSTVRYIELAKKVPKTGTSAIVSGWGTTCWLACDLSNVLMEVEVSFLERKDCASKNYLYGERIKETMVCGYTKEKDSCQGDSGGPFVSEGKLIGVVSWGQGCAMDGYPGVYADVAALRDWVLDNAKTLQITVHAMTFCEMFLLMLVVIALRSVLGEAQNWDWQGRIVNGQPALIEDHPYQVSLQTAENDHFCGGSILSEDIVLTAAHCLDGRKPEDIKVRLGSTTYANGGILVDVKTFKSHEKFNFEETRVNDVAVIKLAKPVKQSSTVRYIKLADSKPATGHPAVVSGWGADCFLVCDLIPNLMSIEVEFVNTKDCANNYEYGTDIKDTMVCATGKEKSSCQGDSGGPLVADGHVVGIVSWSIGCAAEGYPGVYSDVVALRSWIEEAMNSF
uniref:Peptidase S1 domain-containing protein n=1 Tax=Glossina brevipalpis TaxID=37001 RepID=A0A1A9W2I9_9MUSC